MKDPIVAITVEAFLQEKGFRASTHPFQWTNAEQEQRDLPGYFVEVPWFEQLFGDPLNPESLILFAPQGYGKSSHRLQIAQIASRRKVSPLVVAFTSFDLLFENAHVLDTSERYLALIQEATLAQLMHEIQSSKRDVVPLAGHPDLQSQLYALLLVAVPMVAYQYGIYETPLLAPLVQHVRAKRFSLKEGLQVLSTLVRAAGFVSVYFLIDGIDETAYTRRDPLRAATLLSPLLDAPGVLQECGFAFKFFLPANLEPVMREHQIGRLDRIPVYVLTWSETELGRMLQLRLETYSRGSKHTQPVVRTFQDLCEPQPTPVDQQLAQAAQGSPRRMIDLAREIITLHCQQAATTDSLIPPRTIQQVLSVSTREPPQAIASLPVEEPASPVLPPLYFDQRGMVWLGHQPYSELTGLDRKCMDVLWQNRRKTVTYDELIEALYGSDPGDGGDPKDRMYKAVRSLRKKLCIGDADMDTYIRVQSGIGYVLCNYRDTPPVAPKRTDQQDEAHG